MTWYLSSIQSRKCTSQFYSLDLNNGPIFNQNGPTFFPIHFSASDSVKLHNGPINWTDVSCLPKQIVIFFLSNLTE